VFTLEPSQAMTVKFDNVHSHRLQGADLRHDFVLVGHLVIIGVFDEGLALETAKIVEGVLAIVEYASVSLQGFNGDSTAAGSLDCQLEASRAVGLISLISAIVDPIAQTHLLDALAVATTEMDVIMEVFWACGALGHVCGNKMVCLGIATTFI